MTINLSNRQKAIALLLIILLNILFCFLGLNAESFFINSQGISLKGDVFQYSFFNYISYTQIAFNLYGYNAINRFYEKNNLTINNIYEKTYIFLNKKTQNNFLKTNFLSNKLLFKSILLIEIKLKAMQSKDGMK